MAFLANSEFSKESGLAPCTVFRNLSPAELYEKVRHLSQALRLSRPWVAQACGHLSAQKRVAQRRGEAGSFVSAQSTLPRVGAGDDLYLNNTVKLLVGHPAIIPRKHRPSPTTAGPDVRARHPNHVHRCSRDALRSVSRVWWPNGTIKDVHPAHLRLRQPAQQGRSSPTQARHCLAITLRS